MSRILRDICLPSLAQNLAEPAGGMVPAGLGAQASNMDTAPVGGDEHDFVGGYAAVQRTAEARA